MKEIAVTKRNGVVVNHDEMIRAFTMRLAMLKNGDYRIVVESVKHQRSLPQNRLLWLWLTLLEEETGNNKEMLKDFFASMFLRSEVTAFGNTKTIVRGTSSLNVEEMTRFLEQIALWCVENIGITLPSPEELTALGYK